MDAEDREAFVRWQTVTRDHLSASSNLVLGLATGLIVFNGPGGQGEAAAPGWLAAGSLSLLAGSAGVALILSVNRLSDFRKTAQIAKLRGTGEASLADDRIDSRIMGALTWRLFRFQLGLFFAGAIGTAAIVAARYFG